MSVTNDHEGTRCLESQPLLSSQHEQPELLQHDASPTARGRQWHIYLLFVIVAGLDSTVFMLNLPLTRVYESIVCYHYFAAKDPSRFSGPFDIPESLCKASPVQEELALVKGYELLFMALPGLFLAIPYGQLADRWGRRPVLRICVLGLALAMTSVLLVCWFWWLVPLKLVWFAWSLTIIGGGTAVLLSTVFTMLADSIQPADRAATFLQLSVSIFGAQALSTPVAAYTMNHFGVYVPIAAGYALGFFSCLLTLLVPETLPESNNAEPSICDDVMTTPAESESERTNSLKVSWFARMSSNAKSHLTSLAFISKSPNLVALLAAVLLDSFNGSVPYFVVQYTSAKFDAPISQAGLLITIKAIVTMVALLALVPVVGQRLFQDRLGLDARTRDLWLSRLTITCAPVGFFIIVIAPNFAVAGIGLIFTALATGCVNLIRSVATDMIETGQVSQLYGVMNAIQTSGGLISGPLLAELFAAGLRMGGAWVALPFALCAVLGVFSSSIVWLVRLPSHVTEEAL